MLNPELSHFYNKDSLQSLEKIAKWLGKYANNVYISERSNYRIGSGIALPYTMGIVADEKFIINAIIVGLRYVYPLMNIMRCSKIPEDTVKLCS